MRFLRPAGSNHSLLLLNAGARIATLPEEGGGPDPEIPEGLEPVWRAEFIDIDGDQVRQTINNDGSTRLIVRQYANMTIDAVDTRSEATGCATDHGAAQLINFAAVYNARPGETWANTGNSRNMDIGAPVFHHCWDVAGEHETELYALDPDGRLALVPVTVEVQALATPTDISSGGSWPTLENFGVYGLARGGDYRARGELPTDDLVGVRIVATGSGAFPRIAEFNPDRRGLTSTALTTRARDCVLVNIDYEDWRTGLIGASYCGSYGGHCRLTTLCTHPQRYIFEHDGIAGNNQNQANNIRFPRGCFVVNGGVVGSGGAGYCLIGGGRSFNFSGTSFCRTSGGDSGNPMRTYFDFTCMRNVQVWSTTSTFGWIKGSMFPCVYDATPSDPWPDDDTFGDFTTSRALYLANGSDTNYVGNWGVGPRYFWVSHCLWGGAGQFGNPQYLGGWTPQNDDAPTNGETGPWQSEDCFEAGAIGGFEYNRLAYNHAAAITLSGLGLSGRDNRQLNGTLLVPSEDSNPDRTSPGFRGPFYLDDMPRPEFEFSP
jgi:hypothetical protein